jgi:serine/threonine protein kinase
MVKDTIGDFKLVSKLGEGMFGIVFRGKCQTTGREVAIKIEKELDLPTSIVKHEAQVLLSLKGCTGVPPLLGYGLYEGHRYITLPLFDHALIDKVKQEGKLSGLDALIVCDKVKKILKCIHKKGFIHRDVKPDNVMFDNSGNIFLIDYGLATNYITSNVKQTQSGTHVGTYEFLGELGRKGFICTDVDYEGLEKTIEYCIEKN